MEQKPDVVKHFDDFAQDDRWSALYDEDKDPRLSYNFRMRRDRVEELSRPAAAPDAKVLDLGCGPGIMAPFYLGEGCDYHGSDISEQMIAAARERVRSDRASFSVGDVEAGLDFPDGHFDLVVALGLLEYLDRLDAGVAEIVRLTRPGGALIVSVPLRRCANNVTKTLLSPVITRLWSVVKRLRGQKIERHDIYHRRFTPKELARAFAAHGCTRTGDAFYNLLVCAYPLHRIVPGLSHRICQWAETRRQSWLRIFATGYILRCTRPLPRDA